jgi:PIN domain nuclease of toxin-antitoxin system
LNGYLLDTGTALWMTSAPERVSRQQRAAIEAGPVWLSVISFWEVTIKAAGRRLELAEPAKWWRIVIGDLQAGVLQLRPEHVEALIPLSALHRDPFDRMLLAQAKAEDLTLLSSDREMKRYASAGCRIMA